MEALTRNIIFVILCVSCFASNSDINHFGKQEVGLVAKHLAYCRDYDAKLMYSDVFACLEEAENCETELNFSPKPEISEKAPVLCVILYRKNEGPKRRFFENMESYSLFFMENNINRSCFMSYWETVDCESKGNSKDHRGVEIIGATQKKKPCVKFWSKYIGVTHNQINSNWIAYRWNKEGNKQQHNGSYDDEETAAHASDALARKLMANGGQNLKLNFPDDNTEVYARNRKQSNFKSEQKKKGNDKFENTQPTSGGFENDEAETTCSEPDFDIDSKKESKDPAKKQKRSKQTKIPGGIRLNQDVESRCSESDFKNDHKDKKERKDSSIKQKRSKQNEDGSSILNDKIEFGDSRIKDCEPIKGNSRNKKRKRNETSLIRCKKSQIKKKSNLTDVEKQMFGCDECNKFYTKELFLHDHKRFAHDKLEKCDQCGFVFTSASQKIVHLEKHENREYKCKICGLTFPNPYQKWVHQTGHKTAKYTCEYGCEKTFDTWVKRRSHYQYYHSTKK